jgi:hypothetical protein
MHRKRTNRLLLVLLNPGSLLQSISSRVHLSQAVFPDPMQRTWIAISYTDLKFVNCCLRHLLWTVCSLYILHVWALTSSTSLVLATVGPFISHCQVAAEVPKLFCGPVSPLRDISLWRRRRSEREGRIVDVSNIAESAPSAGESDRANT